MGLIFIGKNFHITYSNVDRNLLIIFVGIVLSYIRKILYISTFKRIPNIKKDTPLKMQERNRMIDLLQSVDVVSSINIVKTTACK